MADSQHQPSRSERFIRSAGEVREDPNQRLWWPARVVVQLIQYLIALLMVTVGEAAKAIFKGDAGSKRRRHNARTA